MRTKFTFASARDIHYGKDPVLDALLLHFMTENNLEHSIDPVKNASPEQIRFMISLDDDMFYAPCGDWMLHFLLDERRHPQLLREYGDQWRLVVRLVREHVARGDLRRRILHLCRHKFRMAASAPILIPSRLLKRMLTIFLTQSGLDDPCRAEKRELNRRAQAFVESSFYHRLVNVCPQDHLGCSSIAQLRFELDMLEMERLLFFSTYKPFWKQETPQQMDPDTLRRTLEGVDFRPLRALFAPSRGPLRILYMPRASGGVMLDLQVIRALLRQGHRVVVAFKDGFYFDSVSVWDLESDPVLAAGFKDAYFIQEERITKNELLQAMREHQLVLISDGTRERFNPYRMSVTFARAWKECDLVLAKGEAHYRRFINTSHQFTRDLLVFFRDEQGGFRMFAKPKAPYVRKFSEEALLEKAESIITQMRQARAAGKTVMFYSAVVGSIPGQVKTAIEVLNTFVGFLRSRLEDAFIINPGEHFEEGMDADDLMFMWERVQRSGFLNVWRFQTDQDIEKSFELMGKKVPPVWAGKDATYSTGCTKEMNIALSVQKRHPELQIIGPAPEKFLRRREYGVGRFSDVVMDRTT